MSKSVPISVRLSIKDAGYLSNLQVEGCTTMSEKVRYIVQSARRADDAKSSVEDEREQLKGSLTPLEAHITHFDARGARSELLNYLISWLPNMMAMLEISGLKKDVTLKDMKKIEAEASDRLLDLIDHLSRQSVTAESVNYDAKLMQRMRAPLTELLELLKAKEKKTTTKNKETKNG